MRYLLTDIYIGTVKHSGLEKGTNSNFNISTAHKG